MMALTIIYEKCAWDSAVGITEDSPKTAELALCTGQYGLAFMSTLWALRLLHL